MRLGYVRVSTPDQNPDRQYEVIQADKIFYDQYSGKSSDRPQLNLLLDFVREGDSVHVSSMDRLARNLADLKTIVNFITAKGAKVEFIKENLMFTGEDSPMSLLLLNIMGSFAEFERTLIRERQREGIELAKKRGVYKGRPVKIKPDQLNEIMRLIQEGVPKAAVARKYNVSTVCLFKYLKKQGAQNDSQTSLQSA